MRRYDLPAAAHKAHALVLAPREVIAIHILDLAATGERDINFLAQEALIALGTRL